MTTQGGRATESVSAVGTPAARSTSFANAFDPSICAAAALGPKTVIPFRRSPSAMPADERAFGADHDEVGVERHGQAEQAVGVVGAHRVAASERRDPGVARRGVELGQGGALLEAPRERVLASTGADDHHLHAARILGSWACRRIRQPG